MATTEQMRGLRCAYCHGDLEATPATCPRCHTVVHEDCGRALELCPNLGCGPWEVPQPRVTLGDVLNWCADALVTLFLTTLVVGLVGIVVTALLLIMVSDIHGSFF